MDCCTEKAGAISSADLAEAMASDPENAPAPRHDLKHTCASCGNTGRVVTRKTVLLMLEPEHFDHVGEKEYRFCADPECPVVYFTEHGDVSFTTDALRVRVGLKEKIDPIPLCYCFGFYEADARAEIAATGQSTIPQRITALIKEKMCACPARNPSGACCLGEVNKAVKRLQAEVTSTLQMS